MIRSRRAPESRDQPLYARTLRLRHVTPSGFLCFVFLEGAVALGFLLALAELVSWWGVLVLPITVAVMVKLNDVVAGALTHPYPAAGPGPAARSSGRPSPSETPRPRARRGELAAEDRVSSRAETVDLRQSARSMVGSDATAGNGPGWATNRAEEPSPQAWGPGGSPQWASSAPGARQAAGEFSPRAGGAQQWADEWDLHAQRVRQAAHRRYDV
jgi:hypothetical protein